MKVSGGAIAMAVAEDSEDLNGDGDRGDWVLHYLPGAGRELTNVGTSLSQLETDGADIVFTVRESAEGHRDLNGDGDTFDEVLHLYEPGPGRVRNLRIASGPIRLHEGLLAFTVYEGSQARTDLNGDGDLADQVMHVLDLRHRRVTNLGLAVAHPSDRLWPGDGFVLFTVDEAAQGASDLNGDGDAFDEVFFAFTRRSGQAARLDAEWRPSNTSVTIVDDHAAIVGQGLVRVFDARSGDLSSFTVPAVVAGPVAQWGRRLFLRAYELEDLNGDGDDDDTVLGVLDLESGAYEPIPIAIDRFEFRGRYGLVWVSEQGDGSVDHNHDGDTRDVVVHTVDMETGNVGNLAIASRLGGATFDGCHAAVQVDERDQGAQDLNQDGDAFDDVAVLMDLCRQSTTPTNLSTYYRGTTAILWASRYGLIVGVGEGSQGGMDLNDDEDADDCVLHLVDWETGASRSLGLAHAGYGTSAFGSEAFLVAISERDQGESDLNGDGDTADRVLFTIDPKRAFRGLGRS